MEFFKSTAQYLQMPAEEFEEQYERYPFDDYDSAFYSMEPLETYLTKYVRKNLSQF